MLENPTPHAIVRWARGQKKGFTAAHHLEVLNQNILHNSTY